MYRDRNKEILGEINSLNSLQYGSIVGTNDSGQTSVRSLGKFYSDVMGRELYIGLKEYFNFCGDVLDIQVGCELGLLDLIEKNLPSFVDEFALFHGVFIDSSGEKIGVITEDFSKGGTISVKSVNKFEKEIMPYEIQELLGKPRFLEDLATTSFMVDGRRRLGDFGEFTFGTIEYKDRLGNDYFDVMEDYLVNIVLEGQ